MKKLKTRHVEFIREAELVVGSDRVIGRKEARDLATSKNLEMPNWLFNDKQFRAGRGQYKLPVVSTTTATGNTESNSNS
jgi:hypothetical protein